MLFVLIFLLEACQSKQHKENLKDSNTPEPAEINSTVQVFSDTVYKTSSGKAFRIKCIIQGKSLMDITVSGEGFEHSNDSTILSGVDPLTTVLLGDLNQDGFDEIYLVTTSTGSGSYGTIYDISSNKDLSYSPIHIPEISESDLNDASLFSGYMGHDSIYLSNTKLMRKFPVYREGDANCCPTGGTRTLVYGLYQGEASWILKIE